MFIDGKSGCTADGTQWGQGLFLIVVEHPDGQGIGLRTHLRACVRSVRLTQLGHFMMGETSLARGTRITLSGAYGDDGLPCSLGHKKISPEEVRHIWDHLMPLPPELEKEFWDGGGHNTAGKEAPAMREWAKANLKALRKLIPAFKAEGR